MICSFRFSWHFKRGRTPSEYIEPLAKWSCRIRCVSGDFWWRVNDDYGMDSMRVHFGVFLGQVRVDILTVHLFRKYSSENKMYCMTYDFTDCNDCSYHFFSVSRDNLGRMLCLGHIETKVAALR